MRDRRRREVPLSQSSHQGIDGADAVARGGVVTHVRACQGEGV